MRNRLVRMAEATEVDDRIRRRLQRVVALSTQCAQIQPTRLHPAPTFPNSQTENAARPRSRAFARALAHAGAGAR